MADCGACNLCCRLLSVPDINKPAHMVCWWTGMHGGCERQADKATDPALMACKQFECVWLQSQAHPDLTKIMPRSIRPDMVHVMMGPQDRDDDGLLYVHVDPKFPTAWKEDPVASFLNGILDRGGRLTILIGETRINLPDKTVV